MRAEIIGIMCYAEKGALGSEKLEAVLITGEGLEGDRHTDGVSVITEDARRWVDKQFDKGLCFNKFKENLLVRLSEPDVGQPVAVLRVIERKKCYPDCKLFVKGMACELAKGAFLAEIEQGGAVCIGDFLDVLDTDL